ncbi:cytochrome P450 [Mycolicibacterium komossense]|uniref:Cytochrome P450 n=1 Tax=Mycolicibacterium komossense TaxID=1779 RepID=A0ABT3C9B0_9MYCO|nr:cytochrome P450 [Mycolicibacterium komossense]MCV7226010.1 cytochrome P450 [Mycolicibacterium komossense]
MTTADTSRDLFTQVLDPQNRIDPYPLYRTLREHGPLRLPELNLTVLSSYRECHDALRHPLSSSDRHTSALAQQQIAAGEPPRPFGLAGLVDRRRTPAFLFLDPPDHTRLRKLVSKAFAPKVINQLEPDIVDLVDGLLDTIEEQGRFDAITDLAYPLAVAVICRLLGVPLEDEPQFGRASALVGQSIDPFISLTGETPEGFQERMDAGRWLRKYFRELIEHRRGSPSDDLISAMIAVEESGDQLSVDEIISTCNLLLIAGHESTVSLIATAILAMLRAPAQWSALGADPHRSARVVEETLRYDPPAQLLGRIAAEDITVADHAVTKGDTMVLLLGAAHRDPAANERPDEFDPDRKALRHLGFGHGPHFCLGAPLLRLEASTVLSAVTARFPHARLAAEPTYKPNITLRGMSALPVAV